uniref:INO80 complex subunit B-like n=1 Tax=Hirondellea gigas TaxID=1518452 RepID=A0A2P2HZ33_9CRUS
MRNPRLLTARQRALLEKQRTEDDLPATAAALLISDQQGGGDEALLLLQQQQSDLQQQLMPIIPPEPLLALPSGFKEKVVTQEMLEKKAIKSQRRRAQALEKREEDKKKTVDRLLKKQDTKLLKGGFNKKVVKAEVAMFSYKSRVDGVFISLPAGCDYPIKAQLAQTAPTVRVCGVSGCSNAKRYSCSKTGVPLCSLQCYKTNLLTSSAAQAIC